MTMNQVECNGCACGGRAGSETVDTGAIPAEAAAASELLGRCRALLASLPAEVYVRPSQVLPGGTVGKHMRHLLDHYFALAGAETPGARIDYDHRDRDPATETSVLVGLAMLDRADRQMRALKRESLERTVRVRSMIDAGGAWADHGSTLGRELAFATHHALHHAAMIGAICRELGVAVDPAFGKAPSTTAHESVLRQEIVAR
ncbi:MAG: hypothetical protein AB7K52_05935 [Phycisphaerales bacterium]